MTGAYLDPTKPVALPGQAIRLEPSNTVYEVNAIEQMGRIGPVDFGAAASGSEASESGSNIIELDDELEMRDNQLGQFLVNPLGMMDIEVRQVGSQDQRFVNKNQVGTINASDPPNQRLLFTYESSPPQLILRNNQTYDMAKTLVYFSGFRYVLDPEPMNEGEIGRMAGHPTSVPVDSLKKSPGNAVN